MLPFGSITSIIPLFVLAIAYILFAGATLLNKIKPVTVSKAPDKVIVIEETEHHSEKTLVLSPLFQDLPGINDSYDYKNIPGWYCIRVFDYPPEITCSRFSNFLFSRPPPVFFS